MVVLETKSLNTKVLVETIEPAEFGEHLTDESLLAEGMIAALKNVSTFNQCGQHKITVTQTVASNEMEFAPFQDELPSPAIERSREEQATAGDLICSGSEYDLYDMA